ncbi:hypothetical protein ACFXAO_10355 [Streptomyces lavendulae]|uniref:hypothetical protein n=1 Tax=Streptomyces lavendulae TaxID=1914 RepID=UPI0036C474CD
MAEVERRVRKRISKSRTTNPSWTLLGLFSGIEGYADSIVLKTDFGVQVTIDSRQFAPTEVLKPYRSDGSRQASSHLANHRRSAALVSAFKLRRVAVCSVPHAT